VSSHAFPVSSTVHTVEGLAGKITDQIDGQDGSGPLYAVDWEDGVSDVQPESLFAEYDELEDDE
jgi:hypothetical protein